MVTYGNDEFNEHYEDFDNTDMALMLKTVNRHKLVYVLLYLAIYAVAAGYAFLPQYTNLWATLESVIVVTNLVTLPFLVKCIVMSRSLKRGTFDVGVGFFGGLLALQMFLLFPTIIPIIMWIGSKKKDWGTGLNKLLNNGFVGNGDEGRDAYLTYLKIRKMPLLIKNVISVALGIAAGVAFYFLGKNDASFIALDINQRISTLISVGLVMFLIAEGIGSIVSSIIIKSKFKKAVG